jgi:hypothetical protein
MKTLKNAEAKPRTAARGVCRVCGCTNDDCRQCIERTGSPCFWIEPDLCSACHFVQFDFERTNRAALESHVCHMTLIIERSTGRVRAEALRQRAKAKRRLSHAPRARRQTP